MSIDFNPENHLLLEQSLLRLPQQQMRQNLKLAQKYIEREVTCLTTSTNELVSNVLNGHHSEDVLKQIDTMSARLHGLKKRLEGLKKEEDSLMQKSRLRIAHLQELYAINSVDEAEYQAWNKIRLHRLLVDDLLRSGYFKTANALIDTNPGIRDLVEVDVLVECKRIEERLRDGSTAECLTWCQENRTHLKKVKSSLEFEVRLQQYIEYARDGNTHAAISYYKKHLVPMTDEHLDSILRASGMLIYPASISVVASAASSATSRSTSPSLLADPDHTSSPYADLYSPERWGFLADMFVSTHHEMHAITMPSLLQIALSAGLSALKTPSCKPGLHRPIAFVSSYNSSLCPICSLELSELAKPLPYAHHVRSSVDADPVMLPNGRIYGHQSLLDFAEKSGMPPGRIRDPMATGEWDDKAARRVFPS
ncbi:CTLH/CRA C-terminal to lish motif domain-containing protein [Limtongia smithiae]|uniref:CTLH/CRA C-terminal to lish motif domain-containing protein n=1 Tax=Limtongia smithiae TaxID=1125753 RepID=UPI0034CF6AF6